MTLESSDHSFRPARVAKQEIASAIIGDDFDSDQPSIGSFVLTIEDIDDVAVIPRILVCSSPPCNVPIV